MVFSVRSTARHDAERTKDRNWLIEGELKANLAFTLADAAIRNPLFP